MLVENFSQKSMAWTALIIFHSAHSILNGLIQYVSAPPELTDIKWFMTMRRGFRRAFNFNLDPGKYWISIRRVSVSSQSWLMPKLSVHNMHSITKLNLNCPSYCYHSGIPTATTRDNPLSADLDSEAWALCISNSEFIYLGWECEDGFVDTAVRLPTIAEFQQRNPTGADVCWGASHSHNSLKTCKNKYWLKVQFKVQYSNFAVQWNIFPGLTSLHLHRIFPYPVLYAMVMMTCLFSPISTSRVSHHQLSHYWSSK